MSTYYGPFLPKEASNEHEERLVSFGIELIGTPEGVSWYDIRETLYNDKSVKKVVIMDMDYVIISVLDIEMADQISPNGMIITCVDKMPVKFDGVVGKWKYENNRLKVNNDFIQANMMNMIDEETEYASEQIQHLQDLIDIEDPDSDLVEVRTRIIAWKKYRVQIKQLESEKGIKDLPTRPE